MDWSLALDNLISPPVLFFALGVAAAMARSELTIPEAFAKAMALYLMLAIGFKGGASAAAHGFGGDLAILLLAAIALSAFIPLIAFAVLKVVSNLSRIDAAAVAAHYGSISIVTFIAASESARAAGLEVPGYMVVAAAAMEAPAIVVALMLVGRRIEAASAGDGNATMAGSAGVPWRHVILNGSIVVLVGAFAVGAATGEEGYEEIKPFISDPLKGVLCLFLLDMGIVAGRELSRVRENITPGLIGFGLLMPLVGGVIGAVTGMAIGLDQAGAALLATLSGSASYIAVPAALRIALPEARPAIYLTLSLAVTFPFNLTIGIPVYLAFAGWLVGS